MAICFQDFGRHSKLARDPSILSLREGIKPSGPDLGGAGTQEPARLVEGASGRTSAPSRCVTAQCFGSSVFPLLCAIVSSINEPSIVSQVV